VDKYFRKLPFQQLQTKYNNWFYFNRPLLGENNIVDYASVHTTFAAAVDKQFHIKFIHDIGY